MEKGVHVQREAILPMPFLLQTPECRRSPGQGVIDDEEPIWPSDGKKIN
jgi:hypothetical protein